MIITSPRLLLRPWQRADLDALAALPRFREPLEQDWNWAHTLRANGTADFFFLGRAYDPNRAEWTILAQQQVIGHLGIREIDRSQRRARLGMGLGAPYISQGYGYEALRAFLDAFFGPLEFREMLLDVRAHNRRAWRMYQRLGFRETERYWQSAGVPEEYAFLAEPQYDDLRDGFRVGREHVLVRCITMRLHADDWPPEHHTDRAG